MKTLKFKTNIKCTGCIEKITPSLNKEVGDANWHVDLQDPNKTLTVQVDDGKQYKVVEALESIGYNASPVN